MKTKYLYIAQFLAWAGFTFVDFIGRKTSIDNYFKKITSINLKEAICFGIPIILAVFYFIGKTYYGISKRQPLKKQLKRLARLIGIWLLITIISTIVISALVCNDVWIVPQYGFDALYYPILGYLLLFIPTGFVLVGEILILIIVKCNAHCKFHKS